MQQTSADSLCKVLRPGQWHAHATCVALGDRGLVMLGQSGSGKSSLAAEMIAMGGALVADDAVILAADQCSATVTCRAPDNAPARLEMRGLGLLPVPLQPSAILSCCVILSSEAPPRFPAKEHLVFDDISIPLYKPQYVAGLGAKLFLLLRHGGECLRA